MSESSQSRVEKVNKVEELQNTKGSCLGCLTKLNEVCVAISCGGGSFSPDGAYVSSWDSVTPMTGKYTTNYSQYQEDVDCVCLLKNSISSNDEV